MIITVGDSITYGHCSERHEGWPGMIKANLAPWGDKNSRQVWHVLNLALPATSVGMGAQLLDGFLGAMRGRVIAGEKEPAVYAGRSLLVMAMVGGRESMTEITDQAGAQIETPIVPINEFGQDVLKLVRVCQTHRAQTAFIGNSLVTRTEPYTRGGQPYRASDERYAAYQAPVRALAAAIGAPFVEVHDAMKERSAFEPVMAEDGIHPNEIGQRIVADAAQEVADAFYAGSWVRQQLLPADFALPEFAQPTC